MENKDQLLQAFLKTVEEMNIEMSFTFLLNGQTITGRVASRKRYLQVVAENFKSSGNKAVNTIGENFDSLIAECDNNSNSIEEINYIHILNASIVDTNYNIFELKSPLRVKVSDVSGFVFGELTRD